MANPKLNIVPGHYDGGHGDEPPMSLEPRVARLESDVEYIKRDISDIKVEMKEFRAEMKDMRELHHKDFRILFGAIIAATLSLASLMATGFNWI